MSLVYLDELCDSISETYDKNTKEIVLINTSDVFEGKVTNHVYVPNKNIKGQFKKLFKKGDILYSEIRPANKHYAFVDFESKNYVASTKLMVLRAKKDKVRPKYLYYLLKSNVVINYLQGLAESRSGTFPQITFSELSTIDITLHSLETQDKIVNIIDAIELKIETLQNINKNLDTYVVIQFILVIVNLYLSLIFNNLIFIKLTDLEMCLVKIVIFKDYKSLDNFELERNLINIIIDILPEIIKLIFN